LRSLRPIAGKPRRCGRCSQKSCGSHSGRALWIMLLPLCPLIGYSFFRLFRSTGSKHGGCNLRCCKQPVAARRHSCAHTRFVLCRGNPLFPFAHPRTWPEKETGALRLLVQLPYRPSTLVSAKLAAVLAAWGLPVSPRSPPCLLAFWWAFGGGGDSKPPLWSSGLHWWSARSRYSRHRSRMARLPPLSRLPSPLDQGS
jgi:hypothetical protein